ncbi:2-hydroxyacid dehydrogenase [Pseudotabrizicola sp.]|uniref:2-hydroxyacid dehydrogenase n=1 Tax=Pseudotabrizicola sp. TaxID=2939647 RepID=UPI00271946E8|nr:2-hydroxyacid dehydrogenase [Pseudotabrizicola sp.]MDO8885271.1 2-hydroxyacid dehydrogenase [Pseudotabrizicola sp.]
MKPDVLVFSPLLPPYLEAMAARYTLHRHDLADEDGKAAMLADVGPRVRAVLVSGHVALTETIVAALPNLEIASCSSAGYDTIDVNALTVRGIPLTNTSDALSDDVADTAMMLALAARRGLVAAHRHVTSGDWGQTGAFPLQSSLRAKRLGIVGMGKIAQAIIPRAEASGMEVAYFSRTEKPGINRPFQPDLMALAQWADILIVIVAGGAGTMNLIDGAVLRALGPQGTLVNVSRGSVVDESALIAALQTGALGHAALDVFWNEPNPNPVLTSLPNVTLYPHHASGTHETRSAMSQLAVDNLDAHFAGAQLLSRVN